MNIKALAHVCLKTTDLEATLAFYCDGLGLEKCFTFRRRETIIGYYLKASDRTFLEVFLEGETQPGAPNQNLHHFCLETADIEKTRQALLARGDHPGEIRMGADETWQFWVKDPSGLDLEFHQYTERSAQFTGRDVEVNW